MDDFINFNIRTCDAVKEMESTLRTKIKNGKISTKAIKDFLKKYFEGDPDCKDCPTGCKEPIECYLNIHLALVDDSGIPQTFGMGYTRDNGHYCCGKALSQLNKNEYCTICGNEY